MATKIVTKNSSTASAVPTTSDLVQGELAVNVADKRLFTENNGGAIVELGTNPSTLTVTGEITANGGIALGDNDKATFGASDDLQIYHSGTGSYIDDAATGHLYIRTQGDGIYFQSIAGEQIAHFNVNGSNKFYYDNAEKLATTSTGIDVTGTATMDGLVVEPSSATGLTYAADGTNSYINFEANSISDSVQLYAGQSSGGFFSIGTKNSGGTLAEAMRIDSSGRVSVGTKAWITADANVGYFGGNDTQSNHISFYDSLNLCRIYTDGNERMRIDASGNLLVGTTNTLPAIGNVEGISLSAGSFGGRFEASRDGAEAVAINRMTNDGSLMSFKKDGTTVGSIGSVAGARPYFAGNNVGLSPYNNIIYPTNVSGATSNGAVDLGASGQRFKDLYLSGGVYLGGTGAANKLDDYEEGSGSSVVKVGGTVVTQSSSRGYKYVKVGNIVTFYFEFRVGNLNGGTGEATIDLPFTCGEYGVGGVRVYNGAVVGTEFLGVSPGSTLCKFKTNVNNTATGNMALTVNGYYYGSVTYIVS